MESREVPLYTSLLFSHSFKGISIPFLSTHENRMPESYWRAIRLRGGETCGPVSSPQNPRVKEKQSVKHLTKE